MTSGSCFFRPPITLMALLIWVNSPALVFSQTSTIQSQFPYSSSSAIEIDPSTGTANYSVPLRVPQGRGSISPEFAITYNSSQGNGIYGVGWSDTIGYIERSTKNGVPSYTASDTFQLILAGSAVELVHDAATLRYYPKVEGGFQKIEKRGNFWLVTDSMGTQYQFGYSSSSRIHDPADATRIFRWSLDRITDMSGNEMEITYTKDSSWLYPDEIRYTSNPSENLEHYAVVKFQLQSGARSDSQWSFHPGFEVRLKRLVDSIFVTADGHHYARYNINYEMSANTRRSLINSIELDAGVANDPPPPITFTYQQQRGYSRDDNWDIPDGMEFYSQIEVQTLPDYSLELLYHDKGVRQVDINNDGWMDFVKSISGEARQVYLNNGDYTYSSNVSEYPAGAPHLVEASSVMPLDTGSKFVDINGDGRLDFVQNRASYVVPQGNSTERKVFLRLENGWSGNQTQWYLPSDTPLMKKVCSILCYQRYVGTVLTDINNDGLVDIVRSHMEDNVHRVYRNTGSGWSLDNGWNLPATEYTDFSDGATLGDLNGDRLPDIFYLNNGVAKVFMNEGDGWYEDVDSPWAQAYPFFDIDSGATQLADVNGDGLVDMFHSRKVVTHGATGGTYDKSIRINAGGGWVEDSVYNIDDADFQMKGTRLFDADGDGLIDFMTNIPSETKRLNLQSGRMPDLMVSINNGIGGVRSIEYVSSTDFHQELMPFARPVVGRMIHSIGGTPEAYITEYEYYDGVYSGNDREFYGFGMVVSKDSEGNSTETLYHTDSLMQGRPTEQRVYDHDDVLFSKTQYSWGSQNIVSGSDFVYLQRTDNFIYDGDQDGRRTAEEHHYVEHLPGIWLLDHTIHLGEVDFDTGEDIGIDMRRRYNEYVSNEVNWLIGLPQKTWTTFTSGQYHTYTEYIYDNTAAVGEDPVQGRVTQKGEWYTDFILQNEMQWTNYEYSTCGNLLKTIDPQGNESLVVYDDDFELFTLAIENDHQHTVTNSYFGVNGEGLVSSDGLSGMWGQLKSSTDPNLQTSRRDYDDLGRVTAQISPFDSASFPTQMADIEYHPTYIRHSSSVRIRHGENITVDRVDFYDALGRKIQSKTTSSTPGMFIVSDQVEYNERGLPVKSYFPYYSSNDLNTLDLIDVNAAYIQTDYDALGRKIQVTQPDGSYVNMEYDDWTTTTYDANGHMQKAYYDAYGQLIRKEYYSGADGRSPQYPASPYELYTATEYVYDEQGNLIETHADADQANIVTRIHYDSLNRKVWMEDPDMGRWEYEYDRNGNLTKQTDALGQEIMFHYDELNRLITKTLGTSGASVVYDYDSDVLGGGNDVGRMSSSSYVSGGASFHYDELGREVISTKTLGLVNYDVQREYDALSNLTELIYPTGLPLDYEYNDLGQVVKIQQGDPNILYGDVTLDGNITSIDASLAARFAVKLETPTEEQAVRADVNASGHITSIDASQIARYVIGLVTEFEIANHVQVFASNIRYNVFGQMTYVLMGNGTKTYYLFDSLTQRLSHKKTFSPMANPLEDGKGWALADGDVQDLSYMYDSSGNILTITDLIHTASQTFTYDHLNRLKTADNPGRYGFRNYEYDVLGNIIEKDGKAYTYDANCGGGPHAVCEIYDPVSLDNVIYAYNDNGNMIAKQRFNVGVAQELTEYEYDLENRLIRIRKDGIVKATYEYDGDGGRTRKTVDGVTTNFVGSLYEIGQGGESRHIYLGSQRIATAKEDRFFYYHTDHLGGTNVVTDRDGGVREIREYRPFGVASFSHVNYDDDADQGHFYFTQHYEDPESGLVFMQARYYDPEMGRFIRPDSIIPDANYSESFNRYSYVYNNPIKYNDPSGNFPILGAIIGALIGGITGGIIANRNNQAIWKGVLLGAVQGGFSGAAFGTAFGSLKSHGYLWEFMRSSGAFSLGGQIAGAAGWEQGQQYLNYASAATAGVYVGANVLKGIKDWAYEDRFDLFRLDGSGGNSVASGDHVHLNGVRTDLLGAINEANGYEANVLAYNPTSGPIADVVETTLGKVTLTSSISRQLGGELAGLSNVTLSGFSQGGLIATNTMLNLGARDARGSVSFLWVESSPVNQIKTYASAAIGSGLSRSQILYAHGSVLDFTNFIGPNLNPVYFAGGTVGISLPWIGVSHHHPVR